VRYDFNVLEKRAKELLDENRPADAIKIYLFMADGDQSLDAGYLGLKIGQCYERMNDLHAAKYWYGRALEEDSPIPVRPASVEGRKRLEHVTIGDLVAPHEYVIRENDRPASQRSPPRSSSERDGSS
jgi:tetratricopeptide (TPR) repeat protein